MRQIFDKGATSAVPLTGISKAFACLRHDLLILKLHTYGIEENSLKLLFSYLRKQKTRSI